MKNRNIIASIIEIVIISHGRWGCI